MWQEYLQKMHGLRARIRVRDHRLPYARSDCELTLQVMQQQDSDDDDAEQHSVHDAVRSTVADPVVRDGFQAFRLRNFTGNTSVLRGGAVRVPYE